VNTIFKTLYSSWPELEQVIESLESPNLRGEVFEEFAYAYFQIRSIYYQVSDIWKVNDIPHQLLSSLEIESSDAGIDGLIQQIDGTFTAYQVKFRSNRVKPSYSELTKFWQEARRCDNHLTFANCTNLSELSEKNPKHIQVLSLDLDELDNSFFYELQNLAMAKKERVESFTPAPYQVKMINDVIQGFESSDRGKLIAACGTGKTLTALWIAEEMEAKKILFIAPSIALIKQTLQVWSDQSKKRFEYVAICSDSSVADELEDFRDLETSDLGIPVTTDPSRIAHMLSEFNEEISIVFCTYQSLEALRKAAELVDFKFELAIFDEAHRTAGTNDSDNFSLALFDENISVDKRLFMTATERMIKPKILKKAAQLNRVVFSMDDRRIYGDVFHRFTFGEAIQENVISDYKIIVAGVRSSEVYEWIKHNNLLVDLDDDSEKIQATAENLFKQILLLKVMEKYPVNKTITFHNSIKLAKDFIFGTNENRDSFQNTLKVTKPEIVSSDYFLGHVNGSVNSSRRHKILMDFKSSKYGIVSNSRCLTEGVDVPIIDSIYFVDPRSSLIDIVQACGRALRKPRNGDPKLAYFIIPILIPDGESSEVLNKIDFDMIHMIIQSLREQDNRLEQWVEKLNLSLLTPKGIGRKSKPKSDANNLIECFLPTEFDLGNFEKNLYARIADVNKNPEKSSMEEIKKIRSRKSGTSRIFRTIGDYTWSSYNSSLINPALNVFKSQTSLVKRNEISSINHNAVSHCIKLGVLELVNEDSFILTEIGKLLKLAPDSFNDIFKEQILKYYERQKDITIFPYREILKLLCEFKSISYFEFCFSVFGVSEISPDFHSVMSQRFEYVRNSYINIDMASDKNKLNILKKLNNELETTFTPKDVWTSSTTVSNQWGYWRNHLSLFDPVVTISADGRKLIVEEKRIEEIQELLRETRGVEEAPDLQNLELMYRTRLFNVEMFKLS
jgi:predicted helicase